MKKKYLFPLFLAVFTVSAIATTVNAPMVTAINTEIISKYVNQELPLADPGSLMWNEATPLDIPLSGQTIIAPKSEVSSATSMRVRSLNNGNWVAFLLEWDDPTKDMGGGPTDFKDSAAIQFPSESGQPFVCMGVSRDTVQILNWRADFQQDIELGLPNAADIFPNMWVNIYPGGADTVFLTGLSAGNPLSAVDKTSPVEDLVAGGFGTLTSQLHNDAVGWAEWNDGTWKAVIARPMITIDAEDAQFDGGTETSLAVAAWDGGKGEINGKKSVSTWVTFKIGAPPSDVEQVVSAPPPAAPAPQPEIIVKTEFPTTAMIIISIVFAALVITASAVTWVIARRA